MKQHIRDSDNPTETSTLLEKRSFTSYADEGNWGYFI